MVICGDLAQIDLKNKRETGFSFNHRDMLPSNFADLSNISSGDFSPGASTAAAFLSYFVEDYHKGWLHFDCAATYCKSSTNMWAAGATGVGVRTLAGLLIQQANQ